MIVGSFTHWAANMRVEHPVLNKALEHLQRIVSANPEPGRIDIDGDHMYVNVMSFDAKTEVKDLLAEKHEQYIDIHAVLEGEEIIGWSLESADAEAAQAYNEEQDYALYAVAADEQHITFQRGMFGVFYPSDVHRPGMGPAGSTIKKAVMKLNVELFK